MVNGSITSQMENFFLKRLYVDGKLEGQLKNYYKNGKILEITRLILMV